MAPRHHTIAFKVKPTESELIRSLDEAVKLEDSDRSKFIRNAVRERIRKTLGAGRIASASPRETATR